MKINSKEIKYIVLDEGFSVEIYYDGMFTQFWLCHVYYGIKLNMFDIPEELSNSEIIDFIERNKDEHIEIFKDNYMTSENEI